MYCAALPRRLRMVVPIAQVTSGGLAAPNPQPTTSFWVRTPSARLLMRVAVASFDPAHPDYGSTQLHTYDPGATGRGLANWQATPQVDNTDGAGGLTPPWSVPGALQPAFVDSAGTASRRPLPDGFEYQGGVQLWKFDCNINLVTASVSEKPVAYADVTWEPGPGGDIDDGHLKALFHQCNAWSDVTGGVAVAAFRTA